MMRWMLFTLLSLIALPALAAESVLVLPFQSKSVAPELKQTASELMVIYLKDRGLRVQTPPDDKIPADIDATAKALKVTHIVSGQLTRIGRKALVFAEMRPVGSAKATWTGRLTAQNPEDLEAIMTRLAAGIETGRSVQETIDIHTVTQREAKVLRRKGVNSYFGVAINGIASFTSGDTVLAGLSAYWLYDLRDLLLDLDFHFSSAENKDRFGVSIGGMYPLGQKDFTPYLGGGLEYGYWSQTIEEDRSERYSYENTVDVTGISGYLGAGLLFGRTATASLRADVRYVMAFYELENEVPQGLSFSVGLGF